jgi:PHP family Zn ribbon phosphoesterase
MTSFKRKCSKCECEITYKNKYNMLNAEKKQSKCKSCGLKEVMTEDVKKRMSERFKGEKNPIYGKFGELNPFFGKKHRN